MDSGEIAPEVLHAELAQMDSLLPLEETLETLLKFRNTLPWSVHLTCIGLAGTYFVVVSQPMPGTKHIVCACVPRLWVCKGF